MNKYIKIILFIFILALVPISFFKKDIILNYLNTNNLFFKIRSEMVVNEVWITGLNFEEKENIISSLKFNIGDPIYSIDLAEVKSRIDKLDWVNKVKVLAYPYGVIEIFIEEYKPFAVYNNAQEYFLINDEGFKFLKINKNEYKVHFQISGKDSLISLDDLKKLIQLFDNFNIKIDKVVRIDSRRWDFYFKNGLLIKLPAKETFLVLKKFMNLDLNKMDYNKIGVIDLRIAERLIIENK